MDYNTPIAQRLISRLNHTAYITEHRCDVEDNEFIDELIHLNAEITLFLVREVNVSSEIYLQRLSDIQSEFVKQETDTSTEFAHVTKQIRAATQLLRNQLVAKPPAPILAFGIK